MPYLKYYVEEKNIPNYSRPIVNGVEGLKILVPKLARHYKLGRHFQLYLTSGHRSSCGTSSYIKINTDSHLTYGVLAHEIAHAIHQRKGRVKQKLIPEAERVHPNITHESVKERAHGKKHRRITLRVLSYLERKQWFEQEITRRLTPRPEKPEPTRDELLEAKMKKATEYGIKCQKTINHLEALKWMWEKKLSRVQRSLRMLEKNRVFKA